MGAGRLIPSLTGPIEQLSCALFVEQRAQVIGEQHRQPEARAEISQPTALLERRGGLAHVERHPAAAGEALAEPGASRGESSGAGRFLNASRSRHVLLRAWELQRL